MKKQRKNKPYQQNKRNAWIALLGVLCVSMFILLAHNNYTDRMIIKDGELRTVQIVKMNYGGRGTSSGSILLDGVEFHVSKLSSNLLVGDSIQVRYDINRKKALKASLTDFNFNFDLALYSILLIIGLGLFYAGITGKGR